jgi:ribonuclease P protein subunit POP4
MVKKKTFPHELVGEEVYVVKSTHPGYVGIMGKVVDETKSTIRIEHNHKIKMLLKAAIDLQLLKSGALIQGKALIKRPEERLK